MSNKHVLHVDHPNEEWRPLTGLENYGLWDGLFDESNPDLQTPASFASCRAALFTNAVLSKLMATTITIELYVLLGDMDVIATLFRSQIPDFPDTMVPKMTVQGIPGTV